MAQDTEKLRPQFLFFLLFAFLQKNKKAHSVQGMGFYF
jgi:hypothetical protein